MDAPTVVVVGGGFAGFYAMRTLERLLPPEAADLVLVSATGMDVRLGTTVSEVAEDGLLLSDGTRLATRTLLWTVGVTPPPLVQRLDVQTSRGRLVADLGGTAAVARPLGVPLSVPVAKVVTKAYHLYAVPAAANRLRIAADWAVTLVSRPVAAQIGLVDPVAARLGREREPGSGRSVAAG